MKKLISFTTLFMIITSQLFSQNINWQKTIGGGLEDKLNSIESTSDGGYILGGNSKSNISGDKNENSRGGYDYWVVKLDSLGELEWQKTIGGENDDYLFSVVQTVDRGFVLGGFSLSGISGNKTETSYGARDSWILKLDSIGNIEWQKTIGGEGQDYTYAIHQTLDGGFILGGHSDSKDSGNVIKDSRGGSDYWIAKLNENGNIEWQKRYGGEGYEYIFSIQQTNDEGFILGGYSNSDASGDKSENSRGFFDYWIVKVDSQGNLEWENTIGGNQPEYLTSIIETDDGYIALGESSSNISGDKTENGRGDRDYWIVKVSFDGTLDWQKTIGGNADDHARTIIPQDDGGYIVSGYSFSDESGEKSENSFGDSDFWIIKIDDVGNIMWDKTWGGNMDDVLIFESASQKTNKDLIIAGTSSSNISGDKEENSKGLEDFWMLNLGGGINPSTNINELFFSNELLIYPNPSINTIRLSPTLRDIKSVNVYDVFGREVLRNGEMQILESLDISLLGNGIYVLKVKTKEKEYTAKFVKKRNR